MDFKFLKLIALAITIILFLLSRLKKFSGIRLVKRRELESEKVTKELNNIIYKIDKKYTQKVINIKSLGINNDLGIFNSSLNGIPYLPKDEKVPINSRGNQLMLLAQINCEELPKNDIYPKKGILQFWISGEDEVYGCDFDEGTKQDGFRIKYYEDIDFSITKESVLKKYNPLKEESPFTKVNDIVEISFELDYSYFDYVDQTYFKELVINEYRKEYSYRKNLEEIIEILYNLDYTYEGDNIHRIGNYSNYDDEYNYLLLRLCSEREKDASYYRISWGDLGTARFLIKREDLKNLNFDDVLYIWECY